MTASPGSPSQPLPHYAGARRPTFLTAAGREAAALGLLPSMAMPTAAPSSPPVALAGQSVALTTISAVARLPQAAAPSDVRAIDKSATAKALIGLDPLEAAAAFQAAGGAVTPKAAAAQGTSWLGITAASSETKPPSGLTPPDQGL